MISYVRDFLKRNDEYATDLPERLMFRKKFDHVMRVYKWAQRLLEKEKGNAGVVYTAAIFHDIGKSLNKAVPHAVTSAKMCYDYLKANNYDEAFIARVVSAVSNHSSKKAIDLDMPIEDKILIDADILDETGALCVLWDSMSIAIEPFPSYEEVYNRNLESYSELIKNKKLFRTNYGSKLYAERLDFFKLYLKNLEYELGLNSKC